MALFNSRDGKSRFSTEAENYPKKRKVLPWKWIFICVLILVAGFRVYKGYFPRSVDQQELSTTISSYARELCNQDLNLVSDKKMGDIEPSLKWTHCSSSHCEVWIVLDSSIPTENAEAFAKKINNYIERQLKSTYKISELQLIDEKCLISVFVISEVSGKRELYGGAVQSFANGKDITSWLNESDVKYLFSNSLPIEL